MKKQLLRKISTALFILAVSAYFANISGQVKVIFENGDDRDLNRTEGIANRDALHLNYAIDGSGNVSMEAVSSSTDEKVIALLDSWDLADAGTTDVASLFGKTFSLVLTTNNKRLDCREKGGLGIQGQNSGRIDGNGTEELYITLEGSVGVKIDSFMYEPTERGGGDNAHFVLRDHDTDSLFYTPAGDSVVNLDDELIYLRFAPESLTIKESDTLAGGGRLLGLFFTLTAPTNPAVAGISPTPGDTLLDVSSDFVILFNTVMDPAATEAAVTFTPALTNRVNTWNGTNEELTVSSDDMDFFTDYVLNISTDILSASGTNALASAMYDYQTLPDAPTVISTYPANEAVEIPVSTPMILEFTRSMNRDSVVNALSFAPALSNASYSWNSASTKLVVSADDLELGTEYTATVGTDATDIYGVSFAESVVFTFTTVTPVSVENALQKDFVLYPNPVSEVLYIKGIDVSELSIHNLTGQLMKSMYNSSEIDMSDIEAGSYFVTVRDKDANSVRKLIVKQ